MSRNKGKQAKEEKTAEKAGALAARGMKLDANGREIISPRDTIAASDKARSNRDTPAKAARRSSDRQLPDSTEIAGIYKSTLSGNADGTAQVRDKSVLGGRFTRQEVHMKDEKGEMKRVEKVQANALRTRQVSYGEDGSKLASTTVKGGVQFTKSTDKDGKSDLMALKVGKVFERRYGLDADGNKVLVASRTGLSSTNTIAKADGATLTKQKQLGGLRSTTTAKDADGNEQVVAKRRGAYRSSTYMNEDGTGTTVKSRKGLYTKTSEQSLQKNEDGSYKIVETTRTSRFGGLYKKTSARDVDLSDTQKKSLGAKQEKEMGEAAAGSAKALHQAVKDIREGKGGVDAKGLFASVQDFADKTKQYRQARIANGEHNVPKTRSLMQQFAETAERDDRLKGVDHAGAKKELEVKAMTLLYAVKGSKGEFATIKDARAHAYGNFKEAAKDYSHILTRDGLETRPQSISAIQNNAFREAKSNDDASYQKALDRRAGSDREGKIAIAAESNFSKAKEADHFRDFVNTIDLDKLNAMSGRALAKARDANTRPTAELTKENLAKLNAEAGDAAKPNVTKAPSVYSAASDDSFVTAKSGLPQSGGAAKPKDQNQRQPLDNRDRGLPGMSV